MIPSTLLNSYDLLPLTCSRTGTCCHGKLVLVNPWELACLAKEKKITQREFREHYCEWGGIKLRFDGEVGYKNEKACSQYLPQHGCSVHEGRPLSCRLYPLGRQIQSQEVQCIFQGQKFPCLEGCPIVTELPQLEVKEYLKGQKTDLFEKAQDGYLELMQGLADIAFVFLLETGLAATSDRKTLHLWRMMGHEMPQILEDRIGWDWLDALTLPTIEAIENPTFFIQKHSELLQMKAQQEFSSLQSLDQYHEASVLMMGIALHLARSLGANPLELAELWVETARTHGALE